MIDNDLQIKIESDDGKPSAPKRNVIDLDKIENKILLASGSTVGGCPGCFFEGKDRKKEHLIVHSNGAFGCCVDQSKAHNRLILQLVGTESDGVIEYYHQEDPKLSNSVSFYDEKLLSKLVKDYSYWINRGIKEEIISSYEGGLAISGKLGDRYVFPVRDKNNMLVGFTGRYIKDIPKWSKTPRWRHLGRKKIWIHDGKRVINETKKEGYAIITEGIGCALALRQSGLKCFYPIFGTVASSTIISSIISCAPKNIIISLNNEKSGIGNEAAEDLRNTLINFFNPDNIHIRLPNSGKDWLDANEIERNEFKNWVESL